MNLILQSIRADLETFRKSMAAGEDVSKQITLLASAVDWLCDRLEERMEDSCSLSYVSSGVESESRFPSQNN